MNLDFICIGAKHAGLNELENLLRRHNSIYMPSQTNTGFFESNHCLEPKSLELYKKKFKDRKAGKLTGTLEADVHLNNANINRITQVFGAQVKFLFVIRNPIDRAFHHYLNSYRNGAEKLDFMEAIKSENHWLKNTDTNNGLLLNAYGNSSEDLNGYIYSGDYFKTLDFLYKNYSKELVKIVDFENLKNLNKPIIDSICEFLGLPFQEGLLPPKVKPKLFSRLRPYRSYLNKPVALDENVRSYLYYTYFKSNIDKTEKLLNRSLSHWRVV